MRPSEIFLFGALSGLAACGGKPDVGSSYPQSSYESSDGSGGGAEETADGDRPSDREILQDYAWENYRNALAQAVSGDYEDDSWEMYTAEDEDIHIADTSADLIVDLPCEVEQQPECDEDRQVSVVFGIVSDCDFADLDVVQSPVMVAAPHDSYGLGGGTYTYYSVVFDEGRLEFDGPGSQVGVMAVPFAWERDGNAVRNVHVVPYLGATCFEMDDDGELVVHYSFAIE